MDMKEFSLENLTDLDDGAALAAFQAHVKRAAQDCWDRPGEKKKRTITLQVSVTPVLLPNGDCSEVKATIIAKSSIPELKTREYSFGLRKNGFAFNPDSIDNVNQTTFINDKD